MYGKIFDSIFDSTLMTDGGFVAAYVFMSMVVLADENGFVDISIDSLYRRLGFPDDFVVRMEFDRVLMLLEAPDERSNLPTEGGKRIIPLSEFGEIVGNRGWVIVNYLHYRNKNNRVESTKNRAEYMREYMQRRRDSEKNTNEINDVNTCKQSLTPVSEKPSYTDTDTDTDTKIKRLGQNKNRFDLFWSSYPKKVKRKKAAEIWKRKKLDPLAEKLSLDVENRLQNDRQWKEGYIPDPTTYLNGELWIDEIQKPFAKEPEMKSQSQILRVGSQKGLTPRPGESNDDYANRIRMTR